MKMLRSTAIAVVAVCMWWASLGSWLMIQQISLYPYRSTIALQDEFCTGTNSNGNIGDLGWSSAGTISTTTGTADHPCLYRVNTGSSSATTAAIHFAVSVSYSPTYAHSLIWQVRLNTNDANTTTRFGEANSVLGAPPDDGIYFEKLDADTNWFCVTRAATVQTGSRTDSGVAVSTNFIEFGISRNSSGVTWTINGAPVCGTHTTNIPTVMVGAYGYIINSAAAPKTFDADYFQFMQSGLSR